MRFYIETPEELLAYYINLRGDAIVGEKEAITKRDRKHYTGMVAAYAFCIFALEQHIKTLAEAKAQVAA